MYTEHQKIKRLQWVLWIIYLSFAALMLRLGHLCVIKHSNLLERAHKNALVTSYIANHRGRIYSRNKTILAGNMPIFHVHITQQSLGEKYKNLEWLMQTLRLSSREREQWLEDAEEQMRSKKSVIIYPITWSQLVCLCTPNAHRPKGVRIKRSFYRIYPLADIFAHNIGYTQRNDHLGTQTGRIGIERYEQKTLMATPQIRRYTIDAKRRIAGLFDKKEGQNGLPYTTSFDERLQRVAHQSLSHHANASAVVLHIPTGQILAMHSVPSFDPNKPHALQPTFYSAVRGLYTPGSITNPIIALAALSLGLCTPTERIVCRRYITVGQHRFHCMHAHGALNITEALSRSCDVFFYELAKRLPFDEIQKAMKDFGLNGSFPPYHTKGFVPDAEWKHKRHHKKWTITDNILLSIGQGGIMVSPLHMATYIARLASNRHVQPSYHYRPLKKSSIFAPLNINNKYLKIVQKGLYDAVHQSYGTCKRLRSKKIAAAAKTGTAQVKRISMQERQTKSHQYWQYMHRDHALCVAYAPFDQPTYAVAVVVEHGQSGSATAVPIAKELLDACADYNAQPLFT